MGQEDSHAFQVPAVGTEAMEVVRLDSILKVGPTGLPAGLEVQGEMTMAPRRWPKQRENGVPNQ